MNNKRIEGSFELIGKDFTLLTHQTRAMKSMREALKGLGDDAVICQIC